jgi:hypothetical protein
MNDLTLSISVIVFGVVLGLLTIYWAGRECVKKDLEVKNSSMGLIK